MFKRGEELHCGFFDSSILRKNVLKSTARTVAFYELELFHTATGTSYINEEKHPARRGMLLCAKPGQSRHSDFPVRCSFIRIAPAAARSHEIEELLASLPDCTYIESKSETEELLGLFSKLSTYLISSAPEQLNDLRIQACLWDILYRVARLCHGAIDTPADTPVSRVTREAYEYINEHYTEDCSLKRIAEAVNVSPNHLHTVFTGNMGITPFAYVTQKRIQQAKRLIMAGERTMLEIAMETGFCSQSHFNKVFKEQTGLTPMGYRKKLLEQY